MTEIKTVAIVGAGAMGSGIAQVCAVAGFDVILCDSKPGQAARALQGIAAQLDKSVQKGRMQVAEAHAAVQRIAASEQLRDIAAAGLVIEAIVENLQAKQELFPLIEEIVADDCLIASNTSSLSITRLAARCRKPQRVAGMHFFYPVPVMRLVEVIEGLRTDPATGDALERVGLKIGKQVVRVKDTPGFLVNQIGRGYTLEAMQVVAEGVAGHADVDRVMREAAGFRMGPFELLDLVGLDVNHPATEAIYRQFYDEPRYRPSDLMDSRVGAGLLGRKTGAGFYVYRDNQPESEPQAPVPVMPDVVPPVWVSRDDPAQGDVLASLLGRLGAELEGGDRPSDGALCLVAPVGEDASRCAARLGLDPVRTLAVDTLFGLDSHRTLMRTCLTGASWCEAAHWLLAADDTPVTVIRDSPGFIAQRVVAMIVNIGTALAQARTAAPDDIDKAVKLALSYPKGPMEFGDSLGVRRMGELMRNLYQSHEDPRYRPSLWLDRRARLGCSLLEGD